MLQHHLYIYTVGDGFNPKRPLVAGSGDLGVPVGVAAMNPLDLNESSFSPPLCLYSDFSFPRHMYGKRKLFSTYWTTATDGEDES